ncbi:TOMM precursor leader peptide-binding protein [Nonomuraea wenchangensis]
MDFDVVVLDTWTLESITELAARAVDGGPAVLPVRCDGGLVLVGPLTGPGTSACVACAEHARIHALPGHPPHTGQVMGGSVPPTVAALVERLAERPQDGVMWAIRGESLEVSTHRVRPFGGCRVCAPLPDDSPRPITIASHPVTGTGLREANPRTAGAGGLREVLLDWRVGPVLRLFRWGSRSLPLASAELPGAADSSEAGYGRAEDFADAERVALFEALERLTGMTPRGSRTVVRAAHAELDPHVAVDPATLGLHEPELTDHPAFRLTPYAPGLPLAWVHGWSLTHGRDRLVPEELVYWRLRGRRSIYDSSNGCGLGSSLAEAILYGLFEVAERDAFLMAWYARTPLRRIATPMEDPQICRLADRLGSLGHDLLLFDATNDFGVPAVLSMIRRRVPDPRRPNALFAAGAHHDPLTAVRSAVVEVYINARNAADPRIVSFDPDRLRPMLEDPTLVRTVDDHVFVNALAEAAPWHSFLSGEETPVSWREVWPRRPAVPDLGEYLSEWVAQLAARGLEVMAVDQSEPVTRERLGLHAAKVIVPGSLPMTFGHVYRRTRGLPRLLEVPARLGRLPAPPRYDDLPFHPHPFP